MSREGLDRSDMLGNNDTHPDGREAEQGGGLYIVDNIDKIRERRSSIILTREVYKIY
jgi:hypothetical protein